jgi:hypothetical protein
MLGMSIAGYALSRVIHHIQYEIIILETLTGFAMVLLGFGISFSQ